MQANLDEYIFKGQVVRFRIEKVDYHANGKLRKKLYTIGHPLDVSYQKIGNREFYEITHVLFKDKVDLPVYTEKGYLPPMIDAYKLLNVRSA